MGMTQLQLKIFSEFRCIGGSCPASCCERWGDINWYEDEIERIKNHDCSPELKELINKSFTQKPDGNFTIREVNGRCPFLDERNFCRIQLEMGHENLSFTCQSYPRRNTYNNGIVMERLACSCVGVLDMLFNDPDAAKLVMRAMHNDLEKASVAESSKTFANNPELKYRNEIFKLLYDVIYDNSYSAETGVVLGALAVQKISQFAENGQAERIPEVIKAIKPQLRNKAQIETLERVQPNYSLKYALVEDILSEYINLNELYYKDNSSGVEKYAEGSRKFAEVFAGREYAMRNLFLNLLMDINMPSFSKSYTLYENYCYYVFCASAFKYFAAVTGFSGGNIEEGFKKIVALISRHYCHNENTIARVLAKMKQLNCTSPAYLASLIK